MSGMIFGGVVFLGLLLVGFAILCVGIYNSLIASKENINKAWANIDVILKQRYDEIPQLIQMCEQYVKFEKSMIDRIMRAREQMVKGKSVDDKAEGFNELTAGIKGLLAVGEAYPELKSNNNFMQIQSRLTHLEEALADRREFYNDSVNVFNIRIQSIPDVFIASMLSYKRQEMFEVKAEEKVLPNLKINMDT